MNIFREFPRKTYLAVAYMLLWVAAALTVYTGCDLFPERHGAISGRGHRRARECRRLDWDRRHAAHFIGIGVHQRFGERAGLEAIGPDLATPASLPPPSR